MLVKDIETIDLFGSSIPFSWLPCHVFVNTCVRVTRIKSIYYLATQIRGPPTFNNLIILTHRDSTYQSRPQHRDGDGKQEPTLEPLTCIVILMLNFSFVKGNNSRGCLFSLFTS